MEELVEMVKALPNAAALHNVHLANSPSFALTVLQLPMMVGSCLRVHALKWALALGATLAQPDDRPDRQEGPEDGGPLHQAKRYTRPDFQQSGAMPGILTTMSTDATSFFSHFFSAETIVVNSSEKKNVTN